MITEAQIAAAIVDYLTSKGWTVYQEVAFEWQLRRIHGLGDWRADIVATRGQLLTVVECKRELSFDVMAQAQRWAPFANSLWAGVPEAKFTEARQLALDVARNHCGLGVLEYGDAGVSERMPAPIGRRARDLLLVTLDPEHQTHAAAGTNTGGQFSPAVRTRESLAAYVLANRGCKLGVALRAVGHHYRSLDIAVDEFTKKIKKGEIHGVFFGWKKGLWPTKEEARNPSVSI